MSDLNHLRKDFLAFFFNKQWRAKAIITRLSTADGKSITHLIVDGNINQQSLFCNRTLEIIYYALKE